MTTAADMRQGMTLAEQSAALQRLVDLDDNWDGEGAEPPSWRAVVRASGVLGWCDRCRLPVVDVDADVLGGVAIVLSAGFDRQAWIPLMNTHSVARDGHAALTDWKSGEVGGVNFDTLSETMGEWLHGWLERRH